MKKTVMAIVVMLFTLCLVAPAYAMNYQYESGADTKSTFGTPTQTDVMPKNPELENVRRNKDVSYFPPSYGIFSGDIPTDPSSLYHDNLRSGEARNVTNSTALGSDNGAVPIIDGTLTASGNLGGTTMSDSGVLISTSLFAQESVNTTPLYYDDGSIGILSIPKLKLSVRVFEGETVDSMKRGVGHFEFTSVWDGNVAFAGHNRGASDYFGGVKNLANSDIITYETKYGIRRYEVYNKVKISDTDYSYLGWTSENIVTLITCVENSPNQRWCVQAREIK